MDRSFKAAYQKFNDLENALIELRRGVNTAGTGTAEIRTNDSETKRIMNTNLFKGQEFTEFNKKDNYGIWIDGVKNDLYRMLPDAKLFVQYAENRPTDNKELTPDHIKYK